MLVYWILVYVLCTIISQANGQVNSSCERGKFGPRCRYNCNCPQSIICNALGECGHGCATHYFGPKCQHVDIVSFEADFSVPSYLRDSNDGTCNPQSNGTSVTMTLRRAVPFTWFRIVVNYTGQPINFTTRINNRVPCPNERKFIVDSRTIDVTCETHIPVRAVHIEGNIVPSICSIYISAGRNLALRETTSQSTTYYSDHLQYGSQNAVDGTTSRIMTSRSCTLTHAEYAGSWWSLNFSIPIIPRLVRVYNTENALRYRLNEFVLRTYTSNGTEITMYKAGIDITTLDIHILKTTPIKYLIIRQSRNFAISDLSLTLCEVEVYGDYSCPDGAYGTFCEHKCSCNKTEMCNEITGACAKACPRGYYGPVCSYNCYRNCMSGECHYKSGNCFSCVPGYIHSDCNTVCPVGMYGSRCLLVCSQGCNETCHPTTGHCSCKIGFSGSLCQGCPTGRYGEECKHDCSQGCTYTCNSVTGFCLCKNGSIGLRCDVCESGLYGKGCDMICNVTCENNTCNKMSGTCRQCKIGVHGSICQECPDYYYGPYCDLACSANCENVTCDRISGKCQHCKDHFLGDHCNECPAKMYGKSCTLQCSGNCLNQTCEKDSGRCSQCQSGYSGANCEVGGFGKLPYWVLILLLNVVAIVGIFCIRKGNKVSSEETNNKKLEGIKK